MSMKMKELVAKTNESKSTILYYIGEGLLPEPSKLKPNVHLYDDSNVNIIKFIKYLQNTFSYTISDIKRIFESNDLVLDGSFEVMINSLDIATAGKNASRYTKIEFLGITGLSQESLDFYLDNGYIYQRDGKFSDTELEMVRILQSIDKLGMDMRLVDSYVSNAKEVALLESDAGTKMFDKTNGGDSAHYEMLFDLVLKLKPYIYNMQTVSKYYQEKRRSV